MGFIWSEQSEGLWGREGMAGLSVSCLGLANEQEAGSFVEGMQRPGVKVSRYQYAV